MFSHIYLPFMKSVFELLVIFVSSCFTRFAMALVAILKSTFNKLIGRQLSNVVRSLFCLGMIVIMLCFCSSVSDSI